MTKPRTTIAANPRSDLPARIVPVALRGFGIALRGFGIALRVVLGDDLCREGDAGLVLRLHGLHALLQAGKPLGQCMRRRPVRHAAIPRTGGDRRASRRSKDPESRSRRSRPLSRRSSTIGLRSGLQHAGAAVGGGSRGRRPGSRPWRHFWTHVGQDSADSGAKPAISRALIEPVPWKTRVVVVARKCSARFLRRDSSRCASRLKVG